MCYIGQTLGDPLSRLETVLRLDTNTEKLKGNPYRELDSLFTRILLDVAPKSLPVVNHVLNLLLWNDGFSDYRLSDEALVQEVVEKFSLLAPGELFHYLINLESVLLDIPKDAPIRFIHASFGDFLRDLSRLGQFCRSDAHSEIILYKITRTLIICGQENQEPRKLPWGLPMHLELERIDPSANIKCTAEILLTPAGSNELVASCIKEAAWWPPSLGEFLCFHSQPNHDPVGFSQSS
jgi:hypothetical protein